MRQVYFSLVLLSIFFSPASNSQNVNDIAVGPFLSFPSDLFSGNSYNIKAKFTNAGTASQANIPTRFSINGLQMGSGTIPFLAPGAADSASFIWIPPTFGFFTLRIYSGLAVDENRLNDTVTAAIYVLPSGFPGTQRMICRNGLNKPILDYTTTYDTINFNIGNACTIWDVNVKIDTLFHTWVSDLNISILHNSIIDTLWINRGGSGDNFIGVLFNDSAGSFPPPPFTGQIKPDRPLKIFNGTSANGQWILRIYDGFLGDIGILKAWCVQVTYQVCLGISGNSGEPLSYYLGQNYPNPFNPVTTIYYSIPKSGQVTLKVFDILGRDIATLVNETKPAGIYAVNFDAANLSSAVYFYKIISDDFVDIKKMVLIK